MGNDHIREWTAEDSRQKIFELALNIARLKLFGVYIDDNGYLTYTGANSESIILTFQAELDHEATSILMLGGWENI